MSNTLHDKLRDEGLLEYGSFIPGELVRATLNLQMPAIATKKLFDFIALRELSAIDQVREALLNDGKYIAASGDGYRILTPGENSAQIDRYLAHAQNKIRRARKLERTSPVMAGQAPSNAPARLLLAGRDLNLQNWKPKPEQGNA